MTNGFHHRRNCQPSARCLPMTSLPQAFERMASRQVVGKLVVVNG